MLRLLHAAIRVLLLAVTWGLVSLRAELGPPDFPTPYGHNPAAGATVGVNGIQLYYETYGRGAPLLVIHGNGGDIHAMSAQIDYFSAHFLVIAADSRGHGRSGVGLDRLTYEQMAEDLHALLTRLHLGPVCILGWSDGGILGLLLAIHHPEDVAKLAVMGANLNPEGAQPWALALVKTQMQQVDAMIARHDQSRPWIRMKQLLVLLGEQPQIPVADLAKISVPTLVMAGDRDVIRDNHTLEIFHGLPHAQLAIFPGATHMIAWQDPDAFNRTVDKFLRSPFAQPDTKDFVGE